MLWVISYPCSSLGRPRIHDASKMSSFYLVFTEINKKTGWMGNCLKSGSEGWTGSSSERRNVAFVICNCPSHPHIDNLKTIKLYFLQPNTTSKTKPMHRGVIYSLKAKYCKNVVWNFMQSVEKKKTLPKILLLQVMQMLASARNVLLMQRIVNCFQKSGISTKS